MYDFFNSNTIVRGSYHSMEEHLLGTILAIFYSNCVKGKTTQLNEVIAKLLAIIQVKPVYRYIRKAFILSLQRIK
jgi:hypothetical protein